MFSASYDDDVPWFICDHNILFLLIAFLLLVVGPLVMFCLSALFGNEGEKGREKVATQLFLETPNPETILQQDESPEGVSQEFSGLHISSGDVTDQTGVPEPSEPTTEGVKEVSRTDQTAGPSKVPSTGSTGSPREPAGRGFDSGRVSYLPQRGSNLMQKKVSSKSDSPVKPGPLLAELEAEVRRIKETFPHGNLKQLMSEIDALKRVRITKGVLGVGEQMPSFRLKAQNGRMVSSKQLLQNGPLIVSFYHGYWSSLCMIELKALQRFLQRFQARGAMLVAISPDTPTNAQRSVTKSGAKFPLLSDKGNVVARKFRLLYEMDAVLPGTFTDSWPLPMVATYVIDRDGTVIDFFVDCDHSKRAEPSDLLEAIPNRPKLGETKAQSSRSWRSSQTAGWLSLGTSWRNSVREKMG